MTINKFPQYNCAGRELAIENIITAGFDYDPERCGNGGSYPQGNIVILFTDGTVIQIEDTSCGDFGTRMFAQAMCMGEKREAAAAYWGTMLDEWQEYSEFTDAHEAYINMVRDALGYNMPYKAEEERA